MAYQTGTASSFSDLVTTIQTFATGNGWTLSGTVLYKSANAYTELSSDTTNLYILGGTGESGGSLTGASSEYARIGTAAEAINWPANYYLFAHTSPDEIICIFNHDSVWFQWLAFGVVDKLGTWNGGNWFGATLQETAPLNQQAFTATDGYSWQSGDPTAHTMPSWAPWWRTDGGYPTYKANCQIYCDLDANTWVSNTSNDPGAVYSAPLMSPLVARSKSTWNEQAVLVNPILAMDRPSGFKSVIAQLPHFRWLRIDNYAPGDIITIGSDEWMVFPFHKKDLDDTSPYSANTGPYGWAIAYDGP